MTCSLRRRATLAAVALLLLSGCATSVTGSAAADLAALEDAQAAELAELQAEAAARAAEEDAARQAAEEEAARAAEEEAARQAAEEEERRAAEEEAPEPLAPVPPTDDAAGGISPAELSTDDVVWVETFCEEFSRVQGAVDNVDAPEPDPDDLQAVAAYLSLLYDHLAQVSEVASMRLEMVPAPGFNGGTELDTAVVGWFGHSAGAYGEAARQIADGAFTTQESLQAFVDSVETIVAEASVPMETAIRALDRPVAEAVGQVPVCAYFFGS